MQIAEQTTDTCKILINRGKDASMPLFMRSAMIRGKLGAKRRVLLCGGVQFIHVKFCTSLDVVVHLVVPGYAFLRSLFLF